MPAALDSSSLSRQQERKQDISLSRKQEREQEVSLSFAWEREQDERAFVLVPSPILGEG